MFSLKLTVQAMPTNFTFTLIEFTTLLQGGGHKETPLWSGSDRVKYIILGMLY